MEATEKTKVLIGALGANDYEEVTYALPIPVKTRYFVYAIAGNLHPARVFILVTEQAKRKHWDSLLQEFRNTANLPEPEPVEIPIGATQKEAQTIFGKIAQAVPENATLVIDITTSLRSIPTLLLSAVRYLQYARNVEIEKIYYGAFEAKTVQVPAYEMDSFVDLLDWASAVDVFRRTGNAVLLAERLEKHTDDLGIGDLSSLVTSLRKLSRALDLTLSQTIVVAAYELVAALTSGGKQSLDRPMSGPIITLLDGTRQEFEPFAIEKPRNDVKAFLEATFALLEWYMARERYANALQLAREWCITWCMFRDKKPNADLWQYKKRQNIANGLKSDPDVGGFWESMRVLRNLIAHTESEEKDFDIDDPAQLDSTIDKIKGVIQEVLKLRGKVDRL